MLIHRLRDLLGRQYRGGTVIAPSAATSTKAAPRRVISLSLVKNEQDIIEPFVRHNLRFVDCMIVLDNGSIDETRTILLECARELGSVIFADSDEFKYTQSERMTGLLHGCQSAFFADFVLLLDADEFISASSRADFRAALETIPSGGIGLVPWRTFVVPPGNATQAAMNPPESIRWRRTTEQPTWKKAILRLDGSYRPDLRIEQGNHTVTSTSGEPLVSVDLDGVVLQHFPVRSHDQIAAKSVVAWMACLAKSQTARTDGACFQWRDCFDLFTSSSTIDDQTLSKVSMCYAQYREAINWSADIVEDRPPADIRRKYSTGAFSTPIAVIGRSWERSLLPRPAFLTFERPEGVTAAASPRVSTAFDPVWHWDHLFVDIPPFRYFAEKYQPPSVLDLGCGIGAYLTLFNRLGSHTVFGVDGIPANATVLGAKEYAVRDLSKSIDLRRTFDLVICVEVVEHLEEQYEDKLLDTIARHAGNRIIFSAAEPGQPGNGHINCKTISYWLERWASRGWIPDLMDSLGMRSLASLSWFRRNLLVLRQGNLDDHREALDVLGAIGARPFNWYGQLPGIREAPFIEPPPPLAGYTT